MPWYKVKHTNGKIDYCYELSECEVAFDFIRRRTWQISIEEWKPKKLDYQSLKTFYEELQNALHSGLQLNQAISHFARSSSHTILSTNCQALLNELENGRLFNDTLSKLTKPAAAPYCQLLNTQGSREDCEKSLSISIRQLTSLLDWSHRLLKAIVYPFCIIQIALIILIANHAMQSPNVEHYYVRIVSDIAIYVVCSIAQLTVINSLNKGHACTWLEKYSQNFRLTKLFSLLNSARQTGVTLQEALKHMPNYFQHAETKVQIYQVYYTLHLGKNYASSFPSTWFPHESTIALHSATKDGNIERALILATNEHEKRWQKNITLLEKLIPAVCLLIAGGFVTSTLIALYKPLLEIH
ncbi:type II secretion system F family protein [Marinomonas shanghaiensis]|uniref:type II secretion system F family protein n=1 Tax=Marinomonas shanghaiensis TaxID=2202418 RepID=UPI000DBA56A6|nr:type II secretion system F family protein [Marinomonas shanghaiensis]